MAIIGDQGWHILIPSMAYIDHKYAIHLHMKGLRLLLTLGIPIHFESSTPSDLELPISLIT